MLYLSGIVLQSPSPVRARCWRGAPSLRVPPRGSCPAAIASVPLPAVPAACWSRSWLRWPGGCSRPAPAGNYRSRTLPVMYISVRCPGISSCLHRSPCGNGTAPVAYLLSHRQSRQDNSGRRCCMHRWGMIAGTWSWMILRRHGYPAYRYSLPPGR